MQNLASRLAAVDTSAGAALDVIAYFDELGRSRAGLEQIVRGAAVLSGVATRLHDLPRRIAIRVDPDGRRTTPTDPPTIGWHTVVVGARGGTARLVLETAPRSALLDELILERALLLVEQVLARTPAPLPPSPDCAMVEILVDPASTPQQKHTAARRSGLRPDGSARIVASSDHDVAVLSADVAPSPGTRAGIGPTTPIAHLPRSAVGARLALRFTAAGTPDDPGRPLVHAEDLGGLELLAAAVDDGAAPTDDYRALRSAERQLPHLTHTLSEFAAAASTRAAAAALHVHHSTMQERLDHAENALGWTVREPTGRLRLHLALAERLLRR